MFNFQRDHEQCMFENLRVLTRNNGLFAYNDIKVYFPAPFPEKYNYNSNTLRNQFYQPNTI